MACVWQTRFSRDSLVSAISTKVQMRLWTSWGQWEDQLDDHRVLNLFLRTMCSCSHLCFILLFIPLTVFFTFSPPVYTQITAVIVLDWVLFHTDIPESKVDILFFNALFKHCGLSVQICFGTTIWIYLWNRLKSYFTFFICNDFYLGISPPVEDLG